MKHTEGSWKAFTANANGFGVTNGDTVIAIAGETDLPENVANANLIAAAPEMLELLKDILSKVLKNHSVATETIDMANDLIAKAEGK